MQHLGRNFFNDTPDFPTILKDLEIASYNFTKNPSRRTQEGINDFKNSKHVISASRYILERSKKPEVHFHAVKALGEAVLKRWYLLQQEEIVDIRSYLINYAIGKTPSELSPLPDFVRSQVIKTIASIIKRGWLSSDLQETPSTETHNNDVINQIMTLLISTDISVREIGTDICTELVAEFSSLSGATKMNLPWEFHRRAKQSFERTHLKTLFYVMVQTVKQIILVPEEHKIHVKKLFKLCSALMDTILSWPFSEDLAVVVGDNDSNVTVLDPGEGWRDLLVRSTDVLQLYFEMYMLCKNDFELSHSVTQGLVQLASLQGKIFEDGQQQSNYLSNFSRGIFHIFYMPDQTSAAVILNIAQMINRLVSSFPFVMFKTITPEPTFFFGHLTKMTQHVLHLAQKDPDTDSYMEAFDEMLKAWVTLVKQFNEIDPLTANFYKDCGLIFQTYAETRILLTSKGDIEKDSKDESEDYKLFSEQLSSICQIGRTEINHTIVTLINLLSDRYNFLHHQGAGGANIGDRLSETRWLVMIAGHLLIEEPKEGQLEIPERIIKLSLSSPSQNQDLVIILISLVFKFIDLENTFINSNQISAWSVNLAQTLIWFMNRWSMAYLFQSKQRLSPNLSGVFGCVEERNATVSIIEFFMKKIVINLMFYSHEISIAEETCDLLFALTKRQIPAEHLLNITSWKELLRMHNMNDNRLNELPGRVHRKLLYALVSMNSLSPNGLQHFADIVHPIRIMLAQLLPINMQQHPQAIKALSFQIERLRGIVRASQQMIAPYIWDFCVQFLDPILSLFPVLKENHDIIQLILGFWVDISRCMLNFLDDGKKDSFLTITFDKLFKEFFSCNFGKKRKKRTTPLQDDQQQKKITQILKVIHGISVVRHQKSSRTVYFGISIIIDALVPELLQFPKLSEIYYTVLQSLFQNHIDKLPQIPDALYPALLNTIESALTHPDYGNFALKCALDSLVNLLAFHFKIRQTPNLDEKTKSFINKSQAAINPFVTKMLEFLLIGDVFNNTITQSAGTAFFALLCFDKVSFIVNLDKLKEEQSPEVKEQVNKAFNAILSIEPAFTSNNCSLFILQFHNFLTVYRGLVKKK